MPNPHCWNCGSQVALGDEYCTCRIDGSPTPLRFGKYQVESRLGSGAFGTVFKCLDPDLRRPVAIKKLDRFAYNVAGRLRELEAPSRLSHPNIVATYDVMLDLGAIVMEFVDGGTLHSKMDSNADWVQENFTQLATEICEALRAAHSESIIHRDIKPENILLTSDGHAKITDFGVCALLSSAEYTDSVAGSPPYMAPEVLAGQPYSFEADVHSLGCVIYEIWAGRLPYSANGGLPAYLAVKSSSVATPLREVSPEADDILSDLVARMLSRGPRRVKSVETVIQQLRFRDPSPLTGVPTIDDLQQRLGAIYGYANSDKSPLYLLVQYLISVRALTQELLRDGSEVQSLEKLFSKSFAWLCAAASSVNVRLGQLIWLKYDGVCPYCRNQVCSCSSGWQGGDKERNSILLERMRDRYVSQAPEPQTFPQYQAMFARMFEESNAEEGPDRIVLHTFSEIAEALDAVLHLLPQTDADSILAMHLEFSDLVAWFFALLNSAHHDFNLMNALDRTFDQGCYACRSKQCVCPEPLGVANWREALKVSAQREGHNEA